MKDEIQKQAGNSTPGSSSAVDNTAQNSSPVLSRPGRSVIWMGALALTFSLLALGAAVSSWYQVAVIARLEAGSQRGVIDRVAGEFDDIKAEQQTANERIGALGPAMSRLENDVSRAISSEADQRAGEFARFRTEFDTLSRSVEKVYEDLGRSVDTWILEETEQLLLLANQRLTLVSDVGLAVTALQLADEKLEEIGDPALLPVRKQIASELAELTAVPRVDIPGIALRILAQIDLVERLPLSEDMNRPQWERGESAVVDGESEEVGSLESAGRQILSDLGRLVRIRKVDDTRLPKLKPVQRFLVNENLKVMLNVAQYSLLRGQAEIYQRNLANAVRWFEGYYDTDDELCIRFLAELTLMQEVPLSATLPPVNASLELLRRHIRERSVR